MAELTVGDRIVIPLSRHKWYDVTDYSPDPEAVQCFATAYQGKRLGETIFMMSRYEDEGDPFALVSKIGGEIKRVALEPYQLEWLWEHITQPCEKTP